MEAAMSCLRLKRWKAVSGNHRVKNVIRSLPDALEHHGKPGGQQLHHPVHQIGLVEMADVLQIIQAAEVTEFRFCQVEQRGLQTHGIPLVSFVGLLRCWPIEVLAY